MNTPLLTTKLHIPPIRPELVSRHRLLERLDEGQRLGCRLTVISAPAGFGKTTLLSEWAHRRGKRTDALSTPICPGMLSQTAPLRVAWLTLDEADNDPARFMAHFIAALRPFDENIGKGALGALQSPRPPALETLLTALMNQINAIPDSFALVLDDYQLISAQTIHGALEFLLEHLPGNMHLLIATRSDPPLSLARLRGRGQLTELRAADLRFTSDEVTAFLNQVMALDLSADDITALVSRTEGWIAGLQMAAISLQSRKQTQSDRDVSGFIEAFTGSHRFILDYLVEEVLNQQPDAIREFLLVTSILNRLTAPLCDTILNGDENDGSPWNSRAILAHLERNNLFLIPLDNERRWYRYHRLFADLLRQRLHQTQPDRVPTLHRRASEWYEQNSFFAAAIEHAFSATDHERAARLIGEHAETLWGRGEQITLLQWMNMLPVEFTASQPLLCIYQAFLLFLAGHLDAAESHLQSAERALKSPPGKEAGATSVNLQRRFDRATAEQYGMIAAVRAYIAFFQGDIPNIIRFSHQALEHLPEGKSMWRGAVASVLGDAHSLTGNMMAADQAYSEALKISQVAGNMYFILLTSLKLAENQRHLGRLQRAGELCRQQLQLVEESGFAQTARAGGLFTIWGDCLREWNDLDEALRYTQRGVELCEQDKNVMLLGYSYFTLMRVLSARGDITGVEESLEKLEKLERDTDMPIPLANAIPAWKVRILMDQGNFEKAAQLVQERGLHVDHDVPHVRTLEYLSLARLLIKQDRSEEALPLLDRLLKSAEADGRMGWVITILVLRTLALQAQGDVAQAMTTLERLLYLAEPEGFVRLFVDEGEPMNALLRQAAARGIAVSYVKKLLKALQNGAEIPHEQLPTNGPSGPRATETASSVLVDPLSERELDVLRLLTTHLSSTEIAAELIIAPSTVRSHIKSIYGKLDVHSRMDAVRQAEDLGLL